MLLTTGFAILVLYSSTRPMTWTGYPRLIIDPMLEIRIRNTEIGIILKVGYLCNMYILGRERASADTSAKHKYLHVFWVYIHCN